MRFQPIVIPAVITFIGLLPTFSVATESDAPEKCINEDCLLGLSEKNSVYVKDEDLPIFVENLARAGKFSAAKTAVARIQISPQKAMIDTLNRQRAEQAIALHELAAQSWASPNQIANYMELDAVAASANEPPEAAKASNYWLAAEEILSRTEPTGVSPELEKLLRSKVIRHNPNATLNDLLQNRLPQVIEKEPMQKQGWHWDYVAQVYTEMGDSVNASKAFDRAEQSGAYDFQGNNQVYVSTTWGWLKLGNFDRALKAAEQVTPKSRAAVLESKVAEALIEAGQKKRAYHALQEAAANSSDESKTDKRIELLGEILDGYVDTGNSQDAKKLADEILDLARLPGLFPAAQINIAAKAYNDIGDHAQAVSLLHEAIEKLPDPHKVIATGVTLGPISGSTLEVGNSIRSSITIEFYRAGDQNDFNAQMESLPSDYQTQTWLNLYSTSRSRHELSPSSDEVLTVIPPKYQTSFLSDVAVSAINIGKPEEAKGLLQKAINNFTDVQSPKTLLYPIKVAYAAGFSDLVTIAFDKAAIAAQKIEDKGERAKELAAIAALEHEFSN